MKKLKLMSGGGRGFFIIKKKSKLIYVEDTTDLENHHFATTNVITDKAMTISECYSHRVKGYSGHLKVSLPR